MEQTNIKISQSYEIHLDHIVNELFAPEEELVCAVNYGGRNAIFGFLIVSTKNLWFTSFLSNGLRKSTKYHDERDVIDYLDDFGSYRVKRTTFPPESPLKKKEINSRNISRYSFADIAQLHRQDYEFSFRKEAQCFIELTFSIKYQEASEIVVLYNFEDGKRIFDLVTAKMNSRNNQSTELKNLLDVYIRLHNLGEITDGAFIEKIKSLV